ncbi:MAG: FGGY family carbohydrate kinase [Candidatus Moduliflexus flocculans]|nr:FGGY family carbohydrate kinase [Candidatus Moduliflexus flocculans]
MGRGGREFPGPDGVGALRSGLGEEHRDIRLQPGHGAGRSGRGASARHGSDLVGLPSRAEGAGALFRLIPEADWYALTGNGFPASLYTVFKILWMRNEDPTLFSRVRAVLGSKDFINLRLTGVAVTDHSYASGSGVYDLEARGYSDRLIAASGLPRSIFPEVVPSTRVLGTLLPAAAQALGLHRDVQVVAGGGQFLHGPGCEEPRRGFGLQLPRLLQLDSRHILPPLIDRTFRPYVFEHVVPGMYNSATAIFSAGTSHNWVLRGTLPGPGGPRRSRGDLREDGSPGPAGSPGFEGPDVQSLPGRRKQPRRQPESARGLPGTHPRAYPGGHGARDPGGYLHGAEDGAGRPGLDDRDPGRDDPGRGRRKKRLLAPDAGRCLWNAGSQDHRGPAGRSPGRRRPGGGGYRGVERLLPGSRSSTRSWTSTSPNLSAERTYAGLMPVFREASKSLSKYGEALPPADR